MAKIIPRPFQRKAVDAVGKAYTTDTGTRSGIHALATGLGKTIISIMTTQEFFHPNTGKRTVFAGGVNRELVFQGYDNYMKFMPELERIQYQNGAFRRGAGIVMGSLNQVDAGLIVASMPTLVEKIPSTIIDAEGEEKITIPEDEPIEEKDVFRDTKGGVFLNPSSSRKFLVSPRFDQILEFGLLDCFIYDEAHHAVSNGALSMFKRMDSLHLILDEPPVFSIGNTATPNREDKIGLSNIYQTIFSNHDIFWGIAHGYLAPLLTPVRMEIGEMVEEDNDGDSFDIEGGSIKGVDNWADMMVKGWKEAAEDRPTIVYIGKMNDTAAIAASKILAYTFNEAGIPAAHLDYAGCIGPDGIPRTTDKRAEILSLYKRGKIKVLVNYGVLIEGVDLPLTSCIMLARKVNELTFTQIIGRGLRVFEGDSKLGLSPKDGLLLIDVTGQALAVDTLASIIGFTADPDDKDRIILDPMMVRDLMQQIHEIWYDNDMQQRVREWSHIQTKYKQKTLEKSISKALIMNVDKATVIDCAIYRVIIEVAYSEDDILNAMDMAGEDTLLSKKGVSTKFSEFEIARSTKNDWKFDPHDGTAALQVGAGDALVILSPNFKAHTRIMKMKMKVEKRLVDPKTFTQHNLIDKAGEELLISMLTALEVYSTFFGEYTLWHVDLTNVSNGYIRIPSDAPRDADGDTHPWFVLSENNLYDVTIAASKYAYTQCDVTDEFIRKNASWKTRKEYGDPILATKGQRFMIRKLGGGDGSEMTKAEASSFITHLAASPSVKRVRDHRLKEVAKLWKLRKEQV